MADIAPAPTTVTRAATVPVTAAKRAAILAFAQLMVRAVMAMAAEAPATDDVKVQTGQTLRG